MFTIATAILSNTCLLVSTKLKHQHQPQLRSGSENSWISELLCFESRSSMSLVGGKHTNDLQIYRSLLETITFSSPRIHPFVSLYYEIRGHGDSCLAPKHDKPLFERRIILETIHSCPCSFCRRSKFRMQNYAREACKHFANSNLY